MAYTAPRTFVTGEVETASIFNTYLRDNDLWVLTDSPACRAYKAAAFSHNSSGAELALTLDTERFDNSAMHSTSSNASRITIPSGGGGKYLFGCSTEWAADANGSYRIIRFKLNGSTYIGIDARSPSASHGSNSTVQTVWAVAAADYVETIGLQDSGGTLNVYGSPGVGPEFFAFWFRT